MREYEFTIGTAETGVRLDRFLTYRLPSTLSRALIQRAIRAGKVTVRGRPAKAHQKLQLGDVIAATIAEVGAKARPLDMTPQDIPLDLVYEDEDLLVVNKPAGLVTHPAPGHWDGTLVNAILWHLGHGTGDGGHVPRPTSHTPARAGIVHRLDKDTSGLLLIAKTERSLISLSRQLKARHIHRRYLALVDGHTALNTGTVDVPIGRHAVHRKEMTVRHLGGRTAVTHYKVVKRLEAGGMKFTLIEAKLETGRTHQIRVHLSHLGHPVLGDTVYGEHAAARWAEHGVARQLLHAYRLSFTHPRTGREVELEAAIPEDMARWLDDEALERAANL